MANFFQKSPKSQVTLVRGPNQPDSAYLESFDNPAQLVVSASGQEVRAAPKGKQSGRSLAPRSSRAGKLNAKIPRNSQK